MKLDMWYDETGFEYFRITIAIPPTDPLQMQKTLAGLQSKDSVAYDKFRIFDVRSSHEGEEAEVDLVVRTNVVDIGKVISVLKQLEARAWGKN